MPALPVFDPLGGQRGVGPTGLVPSLVKSIIFLSSVAYAANLFLTYHARWTFHSTRLAQYETLVKSDVCSKPHIRVLSEEVNNCATAERLVSGGSLSPAALALLETLQRLALCAGEIEDGPSGSVKNRCSEAVEALTAASTKILVLVVLLLFAVIFGMRQYMTINTIRTTRLPLDEAAYPCNSHMPPWLKDE